MAAGKRRPDFRAWVDGRPKADWGLMPLTHITKGILAQDIVREGGIDPKYCDVLKEPLSYFFYGRPAYRVSGDGSVKVEAACPFCFIFDPDLIKRSKKIFAFDTGAFAARMYAHVLLDEMNFDDFSLDRDLDRPNRLIKTVFDNRENYFLANTSAVDVDGLSESWEFLPRSYLQLITSDGRNEPDDRVCSIEVVFGDPVPLSGNLTAIIVPHTMWAGEEKAPWLIRLRESGVLIETYSFVPGRAPEHYQTLLEERVRALYKSMGHL